MTFIGEYKQQCEKSIEKFERRVPPIEYIENGILLSEGFAFCAMADLFKADVIIESGTAGGYSTEIWARYFNKPIYSVDSAELYGINRFQSTKERLAKYQNVNLILGDSFEEIPCLIRKFSSRRIALFIDGPKDELAVKLAERLFFIGSNVIFTGIHDLYEKNVKMDQMFFYTDDGWFLDKYLYLNRVGNVSNSILAEQLAAFPKGMVIGFSAPNRARIVRVSRYLKYLTTSAFVRRQVVDKVRGKYAHIMGFFSRRFPTLYLALKRIKFYFLLFKKRVLR